MSSINRKCVRAPHCLLSGRLCQRQFPEHCVELCRLSEVAGTRAQVTKVEMEGGVVDLNLSEMVVGSLALRFVNKDTGEALPEGRTRPEVILRHLATRPGQVVPPPPFSHTHTHTHTRSFQRNTVQTLRCMHAVVHHRESSRIYCSILVGGAGNLQELCNLLVSSGLPGCLPCLDASLRSKRNCEQVGQRDEAPAAGVQHAAGIPGHRQRVQHGPLR